MRFSFTRFALNLMALGPKQLYACNKAKALYLKDNKQCVLCGALDHLEVHHIIPVSVCPELACEPLNFMTLCDYGNAGCHCHFGHLGSFIKYNRYIQEYVMQCRKFYSDFIPDNCMNNKFIKPFEIKIIPGFK